MEKEDLKCVILKGELSDWGKHVLLPFGCTMCGMATTDCDKEEFTVLKNPKMSDLIFEYTTEKEWDITCEKCLNIFDIIKKGRRNVN